MKSFTALIIFATTVLSENTDRNIREILKPENNYYLWVNENVKKILKTTFAMLDDQNFNRFSKLFANLTGLVEVKFNNQMRLLNVSMTNTEGFSNLTEIIGEAISEIISKNNVGGQIDSDIEHSEEFVDFINKFIKKVDSLSVRDFIDRPSRRNLKPWFPSSETGLQDGPNRRLFRGKPTKIRKFPFMTSVHVAGQFRCSGSIISRDLVITAASCLQLVYNNRFFNENPQSLSVRIGSDYTGHGGELIEAVEVYFHPSYNPRNLNNNIAIIRLQRIIEFSKRKKRVRRIVLDRNDGLLPYDVTGIVTLGWGPLDKSNTYRLGSKLSVDTLQVYHLDECKNIYSRHYVTNQNFCAGYLTKGSGACNKDVGGPGVVSGLLSGIISFGSPSCGSADAPTVFTRIGPYIHWIQDIMDKDRVIHRVPTTLNPRKRTRAGFQKRHTLNENPYYDQEVKQNMRQPDADMSYGMDSDFDIFKPAEKPDIHEHPLVNKSLVFIPELYGITVSNSTPFYTVPDLTLGLETSQSPTSFESDFLLHDSFLTMPSPTPGPSRPTSAEKEDTIITETPETDAATTISAEVTNLTSFNETSVNSTETLETPSQEPNLTGLRYGVMKDFKKLSKTFDSYESTGSDEYNGEGESDVTDYYLHSDTSDFSK